MATAKPKVLDRPPRRRVRRALFWIALLAVVALVWFWKPLDAWAQLGASYGARLGCPCRYIAGRELSDCRSDFEPGMGLVFLSEDAEDKSVTAWVPLLASQTAIYREGQGCVLEKWKD